MNIGRASVPASPDSRPNSGTRTCTFSGLEGTTKRPHLWESAVVPASPDSCHIIPPIQSDPIRPPNFSGRKPPSVHERRGGGGEGGVSGVGGAGRGRSPRIAPPPPPPT